MFVRSLGLLYLELELYVQQLMAEERAHARSNGSTTGAVPFQRAPIRDIGLRAK